MMLREKLILTEQRMTFGEHLEELRSRIINSLYALGLGVVIALLFQNTLFEIVLRPHNVAAKERVRVAGLQVFTRAHAALSDVSEALADLSPDACAGLLPEVARARALQENLAGPLAAALEDAAGDAESRVARVRLLAEGIGRTVAEAVRRELAQAEGGENVSVRLEGIHARFTRLMAAEGGRLKGVFETTAAQKLDGLLPELRERMQAAMARAQDAPAVPDAREKTRGEELGRRFRAALEALEEGVDTVHKDKGAKIVALHYTEQIFTYLKIALILGAFLAHPLVLYQMWRFVGAGLYPQEQKIALSFVPVSLLLFICGVLFGYFMLIPWGLSYLGSYGNPELVDTVLSLGAYLSLFMSLTLVLGLVFQVPLVMFFLSRAGFVEPATFSRVRPYAIVAGVVLGAVLTPPDPFTQVMLAGPLVILYELGIVVSRVAHRKSLQAQADAAGA